MELELEYFKLSRKLAVDIQEKILFLEWANGVQLSQKNKTKFLDKLIKGGFYTFLENNLDKTDFLEFKYFVESLKKVKSEQHSAPMEVAKLLLVTSENIEEVFYRWFDERLSGQGRRVYKLVEFYLEKFYNNNSDLSLWDYIFLFDSDNDLEKPLGVSQVQKEAFRFFKSCVAYQRRLITKSNKANVDGAPEKNEELPGDLAIIPAFQKDSFTLKEIEEIVHFEKRRIGKIDANLLAENILYRLKNMKV
jgi:hypothetical protein